MKISSFFKPLSFLPALAVMYMIYSFSAQDGMTSGELSRKVSYEIVKLVDRIADQNWDEWQIEQHTTEIQWIVRKGAHVSEYFLLAVTVSFPLYVYGVRGFLLMILAGLYCVCFACGDEYHQSMVAGRGPSMKDVGIDSIGIFVGIILVRLLGWSGRMAITGPIYERRQKKEREELDRRESELQRREQELSKRELAMRKRQGASSDPYPAAGSYDPGRLQTDEAYAPFSRKEKKSDRYIYRRNAEAKRAAAAAQSRTPAEHYAGGTAAGAAAQKVSFPEEEEFYNGPSPDELSEDLPLPGFLKGRRKH